MGVTVIVPAQLVVFPPWGVTVTVPVPLEAFSGIFAVMLPGVQELTESGMPFQVTTPLLPNPPPKIPRRVPGYAMNVVWALPVWGHTTSILSPGVVFDAGAGGAVEPSASENPSPDTEGREGVIHVAGSAVADVIIVKAVGPCAVQRSTDAPFIVMALIVVTVVMGQGGTPTSALLSMTHSGRAELPNVVSTIAILAPQPAETFSTYPVHRPDPSFASQVAIVSPNHGDGRSPVLPGIKINGKNGAVPLVGPALSGIPYTPVPNATVKCGPFPTSNVFAPV